MIAVLSVGGSIVAPDAPDTDFLIHFSKMIREWLSADAARKLILVIGGGGPARNYQKAYRTIAEANCKDYSNEQADWIGITATRLNAQLLKAIFGFQQAPMLSSCAFSRQTAAAFNNYAVNLHISQQTHKRSQITFAVFQRHRQNPAACFLIG